jgi:fructose-bisphosphate aldolase class II
LLNTGQYNLETITAVVRAAEKKKSPAQILLFPWALHYSPLLIHLAVAACKTATVPIVLHMDHAQSEEEIIAASEYEFDSIMVDMSHYEKEENLEKTERITKFLHEKGIATEAEPGRINGGEDGVKDTGDLEGLLTTAEEATLFVDTGIDFLAPAFGNIHGNYWGVENIKLEYDRYVVISVLGIRASRARKDVASLGDFPVSKCFWDRRRVLKKSLLEFSNGTYSEIASN